jgi:histidinol dehydrogenase
MRIIDREREQEAFYRALERRAEGGSPDVLRITQDIVASVRRGGDRALLRHTRALDGHGRIRITPEEIDRAARAADRKTVAALKRAAARIRDFHKRQKERSWSYTKGGVTLGQIISPLQRVGVYVPGGKASYPSTVLMNVIPAQVAGVDEIAVVVPTPRGETNPHVMAALSMLGIGEVYSIGGAQAVAALAYGTAAIPRVDKIVGPGNIYVATAKRLVFGTVDIDMIAGPSEILVIADDSADPAFVAADMLGQAEHDELASAVLVTDSRKLAEAVREALDAQLATLARKTVARASLRKYGAIILVGSMEEACSVANRIAPEHLEVMTRKPKALLSRLRNAGAIFLGQFTPEPLGDYAAGPNHTLPTCGTARFSSPLGVYDFMKRTSLLRFDEESFRRLAPTVLAIADAEGLDAHARAVRVRMERGKHR